MQWLPPRQSEMIVSVAAPLAMAKKAKGMSEARSILAEDEGVV